MTSADNGNFKHTAAALIEKGVLTEEDNIRLKEILSKMNRLEAKDVDLLFEMNEAFAEFGAFLGELFVEVLTDYFLGMGESNSAVLSEESARLLSEKLKEGKTDPLKLALVLNIRELAKKYPPEFNDTVLAYTRELMMISGAITRENLELIKKVINGLNEIGRPVSREEVDFLFDLNNEFSGRDNTPFWHDFFGETVTRCILEELAPEGIIDEDKARWLIDKMKSDSRIDDRELSLMVYITINAGECHTLFNNFVLESLKDHVLGDGVIDLFEVDLIKQVIYGSGSARGGDVEFEEAEFLFDLYRAVAGKENAAEWNQLFVSAITDYLLQDSMAPDVMDEKKTDWLRSKVDGSGIDPLFMALMANITANAEYCHPSFNVFVLETMKARILEKKIIDSDDVEMIRHVIYGPGGFYGKKVDYFEANFLFDINDGASNRDNTPSWKELFVTAITDHVVNDPETANEVDVDEAEWLVGRLGEKQGLSENEKAVLAQIRKRSEKIHPELEKLIVAYEL